ncbi:MAG TPA: phosphatase PAP2 family protein [Euzebyales bacterium]|nr:phosphatase PAP2 family protein [Euzebyales bacterium]
MIATVRRAASSAALERAALRSLGVAGGALVVGSLALLSSRRLQRADVRAGDLVRRARSRPSDRVVAACTDLGSLYGVMGVATALALTGHRGLARDVALVGSATWGLSQSAKTRVMRARPYEADGVIRLIRAPTGSSYPSTHAAVAAAMMTVVATDGTRPLQVATSGLTAFVAASRVYVGVHYPSDVVGGVGIGLLLASGWRALRRMVPAAAVPPAGL